MIIQFAIKDFKEDRQYRNLSSKTIAAYLFTLNEFQSFCAERGIINVNDINMATIKGYLLYCQNHRGNNATTRNSKLHTMKIFFNYLQSIELFESRDVYETVSRKARSGDMKAIGLLL